MSIPAAEGVLSPPASVTSLEDPFAISQAAAQRNIPEIQDTIAAIGKLYEPLSEEDKAAIGGMDQGRARSREVHHRSSLHTVNGQVETVVTVGTQMVSGISDPQERREVLTEIMETRLRGYLLPALINVYVEGILDQCVAVEQIHVAGQTWLEREGFDTDTTDKDRRYDLIKLFAADVYDKDEIEEQKWVPTAIANVMAAIAESGLQNSLLKELSEGIFDEHIARDLLQFVADAEAPENGLGKVRQLMRFFSATLPAEFVGDRQRYVEDRLVAVLPDWPLDQRRAVADGRQRLVQRLDSAITDARRFIDSTLISQATDPTAAFDTEIAKLTSLIVKHAPPAGPTKAAVMRARVIQKRKHQPRPVAEQPAAAEDRAEQAPVEPWAMTRLRALDNNGHFEVITDERDALEVIREDYRREYKQQIGSPMDLVVQRLLARIPELDFSKGKISGVVPSKRGIKLGLGSDASTVPLFEYKPTGLADTQGRTALAERARKLRVLFVLLPEHWLGLLAVRERDDMQAFGRNNNIFVGSTRRNK